MLYCLHPACENPQNPDGINFCQTCGARLVLRGRYRVIEPLSRGGFGQTYLAEDIDKLNEQCVIKQLVPQFCGSGAVRTATVLFEQEAQRLQQLGKHPQIPALHAYFKEGDYMYLVQEFIPGKNLLQELEEQGLWSEQQIWDMLRDILPVLQFVHEQQVLHRDIKPPNLIRRQSDRKVVLIDFGCAKQVTTTLIAKTGTTIGSYGYSPYEQIDKGNAFPSSDLYSLGATCFHLLTNLHPKELWKQDGYSWLTRWQQHLNQPLSKELECILSRLLQKEPLQRYQSVAELLQDINKPPWPTSPPTSLPPPLPLPLPPPPPPPQFPELIKKLLRSKVFVPLAIIIALLGCVVGTWNWVPINMHSSILPPPPTQPPVPQPQALNYGDQPLLTEAVNPDSDKGIEAFKAGEYKRASYFFDQAWQHNKKLPENLIYKNNALARKQKFFYTLAVVVPTTNSGGKGDLDKLAQEILRGVADAQNKFNQAGGFNNHLLQIAIAKDSFNPPEASSLARQLVNTQDPLILGVIGHLGLNATKKALDEYKKAGLALISPTSTSSSLNNDVFFKAVFFSNLELMEKLAEHANKTLHYDKVAIFYSQDDPNSVENRDIFQHYFTGTTKIIDMSDRDFNPDKAIASALQEQISAAVLLTGGKYYFKNPLAVARSNSKLPNDKRLKLLASTDFYSSGVLDDGREALDGLTIAVPWFLEAYPSTKFATRSKDLWKGTINYRTAFSFDATRAFIEALSANQNPTRETVLQSLKNINIPADETSGDSLHFSTRGERAGIGEREPILVNVVKTDSVYQFKRISNSSP